MKSDFQQCEGSNTRIYFGRGLRLFDSEEERHEGPVIELIRSMPGVAGADFTDRSSVLITISLRAEWSEVGKQVSSLFRGAATCRDRGFIAVNTLSKDDQLTVLTRTAKALTDAGWERRLPKR